MTKFVATLSIDSPAEIGPKLQELILAFVNREILHADGDVLNLKDDSMPVSRAELDMTSHRLLEPIDVGTFAEATEAQRDQGPGGFRHYLEDFEIEREPDGRCLVRVKPSYKHGTDWQVGLSLTHRLCSELLCDNVGMKENLGQGFRGNIYVDTVSQSPETGWIIMEAADRNDIEAAVTLAEFVHEGTELMD